MKLLPRYAGPGAQRLLVRASCAKSCQTPSESEGSSRAQYNTAVLKMNKGSALGTFVLRTALNHGFDLHPFTVTRYLHDAHLEGLLLQLPTALFDSAWLDIRLFQQDRPPVPSFKSFSDFFETPPASSALPRMIGFDGFFKGAYSYHVHNLWYVYHIIQLFIDYMSLYLDAGTHHTILHGIILT
jgi:hypothetical protein